MSDQQVRIKEGLRWDYYDKVYRLSDVKDMSDIGTLKFQWLPDKGDLVIHEISIVRNGQVIDVLGRGEGIEVLRREQRLEMGVLDGSLTATIAVPGLALGDQVRMRYSVTLSDQALAGDVQGQIRLPRKPSHSKGNAISVMLPGRLGQEADYARVTVSWPAGLDVGYKCWFIGNWKVQLEQGEDACRLAVERGKNASQVLDSRAMYHLRVGMIEKARTDIEEALELDPWQAASLLLRGLIKRLQIDATAEQDIADAIARQPDLADTYSRWGFAIGPAS